MGCLPGAAALKEINSPFPSSHFLPVTSQLGVGLREPLPIHGGILASLILCWSCACSLSWHEFMCAANTVPLYTSVTAGSCDLSATGLMVFDSTKMPEARIWSPFPVGCRPQPSYTNSLVGKTASCPDLEFDFFRAALPATGEERFDEMPRGFTPSLG